MLQRNIKALKKHSLEFLEENFASHAYIHTTTTKNL